MSTATTVDAAPAPAKGSKKKLILIVAAAVLVLAVAGAAAALLLKKKPAHDGEGEHAAGNFQNAEDVFPLLWLVSQQFQTVAALVQVGNDARLEARPERRKTAATQAEPKKGRFEP